MEDSMMLQRKELTDLTLQVANIIYDLYYTQCYVQINKNRKDEDKRKMSLSQKETDDVFQKTEEFLREFSLKTENERIMDLYERILRENKGLLLTEENIEKIVLLVIANCDHPLDIGACVIHYNSFINENDEKLKESLDYVVDKFDEFYINHDLKSFIAFCAESKPLLIRYVINELEVCDLLKPLGSVGDAKVFYINIESRPSPPIGYSSEFSYPLIPYRMVGFINENGDIVPNISEASIHVSITIDDINIYEFDNTSEYINIIIELRDNKYLSDNDDKYIYKIKHIQLDFMDYLKLYMTQDVTEFISTVIYFLSLDDETG